MSRSSVGQMEESQLPFDQFLMAGEGGSQQDLSLSQMPETQLPETQFPAPTMDGSDGSQAEQLHQDFVVLPQAPARAVQVLYSSHDSDGEGMCFSKFHQFGLCIVRATRQCFLTILFL